MIMDLSISDSKISVSSYFLLFIFLCFSGNPLFTAQGYSKLLLVIYGLSFIIYSLFFIRQSILFQSLHVLLLPVVLITILSVFQYVTFQKISIPGIFSLILKISVGYFLLLFFQLQSVNPFVVYIRLMSFLSLISFPFFILNFFIHYGLQLDAEALKSVLFYTSYPLPPSMLRNSGMFWEPGAFAGYLILALIFVVIINREFLVGKFHYEVLLIFIALCSTFSTTGFLTIGFLLLIYVFQNFRFARYLFLPLLFFLFKFFYDQFEFLSDKIEHQFAEAVAMERSEVSNTRFGAFKMDLTYILDQPIIGNGLNKDIRYRFHPLIEEEIGHGNGMSNFIVWWGIPFFVFWLITACLFLYRNTQSFLISIFCTFALLLLLQGEQFLDYPLFLVFFTAYTFKFKETVLFARLASS